jgi:hypothetical protein
MVQFWKKKIVGSEFREILDGGEFLSSLLNIYVILPFILICEAPRASRFCHFIRLYCPDILIVFTVSI